MRNRRKSVNLHAAFAAFAKAVRDMPDDQYEKLVEGDLSFLSASEKSGGRERKAKGNGRALPVPDARKWESIASELDAAPSRDAGARIVQDAFSRKDELFAFAKSLDLAVQRSDNIARIRWKIVEFTVGQRLDGEAIRGGYTAK